MPEEHSVGSSILPLGAINRSKEMTGQSSFFLLLSEQQMEQVIQNPGDFGVTDPEYLIVMTRAGSRKNEDDRSGDQDHTVDSGRV
jgi:hypothetical protein